MEKLIVTGKKILSGVVRISGSKNATLPILAASILSNKKIEIKNVPIVKDVLTMTELLRYIGSNLKINFKRKKILIKNNKELKTIAPYNFVKTMRAGVIILGSMLSKFGKAKVSLPGGCAIGARPVDIHLKALSKLGVKYKIIDGYIYAKAPKGLIGNVIKFSKVSVGATENLIIASSLARGKTVLKNCAIEPEIKDLINCLRKMGCNIKWTGKRTITIIGVNKLVDLKYKVMFDRIEAGTYIIAAALTGGNIIIRNIKSKIINTEINILKKIGVKIKVKENEIRVIGTKKIKSIKIKTSPYPGFPTDLQAQLMVLLCKADGISEINEQIFENRYMHASELNRMGAKIKITGNKAIIMGNTNFEAAELMATDLRASVSLILAALTSKGKSRIHRIYHLDRGYEKIEEKLSKIGAHIRRIN